MYTQHCVCVCVCEHVNYTNRERERELKYLLLCGLCTGKPVPDAVSHPQTSQPVLEVKDIRQLKTGSSMERHK